MIPMKQQNFSNEIQVDGIFGGLEKILKYHERFFQEMKDRLVSWTPDQPFADLLYKEVTFFFGFQY